MREIGTEGTKYEFCVRIIEGDRSWMSPRVKILGG